MSCPVNTPSLLPMVSHYRSLLPITSENHTSRAHVKSIIISPDLIQSKYHLRLFAHVQSEYYLSYPCNNVQLVHHLFCPSTHTVPHHYSPCSVCTPSLQPMSRQYPTVFSPCPVIGICTAHVQRWSHLYSTSPDKMTGPHLCHTSTAHV